MEALGRKSAVFSGGLKAKSCCFIKYQRHLTRGGLQLLVIPFQGMQESFT